jgi:hypothetical protein
VKWHGGLAAGLGIVLAGGGAAAGFFLAGGPWAAAGAVIGAVTGSFAPMVYERVKVSIGVVHKTLTDAFRNSNRSPTAGQGRPQLSNVVTERHAGQFVAGPGRWLTSMIKK